MLSDYQEYLQRKICEEFNTISEAKNWLSEAYGYDINKATLSQLEEALNALNDCSQL